MKKKQHSDDNRQDYGGLKFETEKTVPIHSKTLREILLSWQFYGEIIGYDNRKRRLAQLQEYLLHCNDSVELTDDTRRRLQKP